jgi:hydrogenase maturation protease
MNSATDAETLIIGYGNPIRGDDAVGLRVAELAAADGYNAIAVTQLLPELAEPISKAARVIFVDCDTRLSPGEISISEPESGQSFHGATNPCALLGLAQDLYGRRPAALAIGIGPATTDLSETLSPAVEMILPDVGRALACAELQLSKV